MTESDWTRLSARTIERDARRARARALIRLSAEGLGFTVGLVGGFLREAFHRLEKITAVERACRDLLSLDPVMLKDIGMTTEERRRQILLLEVRKWDILLEGVLPRPGHKQPVRTAKVIPIRRSPPRGPMEAF